MEDTHKQIVILGGGISGLSIAHYLVKSGYKNIVLLEKEKDIGGTGGFYDTGRYKIDTSYHVAFRGDRHLLELVSDLGLSSKMHWFPAKTAFFDGQGFSSFSGPLDILTNFRIGLKEKIDFAKIYLKLKAVKNWTELDRVSAVDWLMKNCSPQTYKRFFQPILNIKWGEQADQVSLAWLWGRLFPRATSRNILGGQEKLGYLLPDGFFMLFSRLKKELSKNKVKIITGAEVNDIAFRKDTVQFIKYKKSQKIKSLRPNILIVTIPISIFIKVSSLPPQPLSRLTTIKYQGVICATLSLKHSLTHGFYQVPISPGKTFAGGFVEHTAAIKSKVYRKENLIYIFKYLPPTSPCWNYTDTELLNLFLNDANSIGDHFIDKDEVSWHHIYRNRFATPVYSTNFINKQPPIQFRQTNLYFTGMTNTYPITDFNCSIKAAKNLVSIITNLYEKN